MPIPLRWRMPALGVGGHAAVSRCLVKPGRREALAQLLLGERPIAGIRHVAYRSNPGALRTIAGILRNCERNGVIARSWLAESRPRWRQMLIHHLGWPARTGRHRGPEQREPQSRVPTGTPSAVILIRTYARSAGTTSGVAWPNATSLAGSNFPFRSRQHPQADRPGLGEHRLRRGAITVIPDGNGGRCPFSYPRCALISASSAACSTALSLPPAAHPGPLATHPGPSPVPAAPGRSGPPGPRPRRQRPVPRPALRPSANTATVTVRLTARTSWIATRRHVSKRPGRENLPRWHG